MRSSKARYRMSQYLLKATTGRGCRYQKIRVEGSDSSSERRQTGAIDPVAALATNDCQEQVRIITSLRANNMAGVMPKDRRHDRLAFDDKK
jgi:hypothetical protein